MKNFSRKSQNNRMFSDKSLMARNIYAKNSKTNLNEKTMSMLKCWRNSQTILKIWLQRCEGNSIVWEKLISSNWKILKNNLNSRGQIYLKNLTQRSLRHLKSIVILKKNMLNNMLRLKKKIQRILKTCVLRDPSIMLN